IGDDIARTLHLVEIRFVQAAEFEVVVIEVKPLIQSKPRVQHSRSDDRARLVSSLFENRGQGRLKRAQFVAAKIMHAAQHRIGSGQHGAVRGQGYGDDGEGAVKAHTIRSQAVDVGRLDLLVSVAANVVGA